MKKQKLTMILAASLLCAALTGCSVTVSTDSDKISTGASATTPKPENAGTAPTDSLPAVDPDIEVVTTLSDIRTEDSIRVFDLTQTSSQFEMKAKFGEAASNRVKMVSVTIKPMGVSFESICELLEMPADAFERDGDVYIAKDVDMDSSMSDTSLDELHEVYELFIAIEQMDKMDDSRQIDFSGAQVYGPDGELLTPIGSDKTDSSGQIDFSGAQVYGPNGELLTPISSDDFTHSFENTEKGIALTTDLGDGITLVEEYSFDANSSDKINYMPGISIQGVGSKSLDDINSYLTSAGLSEIKQTDIIGRFDTLSGGTWLISSSTFNVFSQDAMYKIESAVEGERILKSFCE